MDSAIIPIVMQFAFATLLPGMVSVLLVVLGRNTKLGALSYGRQQVIYGIVFGIVAIFGTEFGIETYDATMNVRDAAPIVAGLYFGGPAGIIAGLIGAVERWFSVLWGRGMFTRVACTIATAAAGLYAALLNRYVFEGRKPSWSLAFATGVVAEVLHLLLAFYTNLDSPLQAFHVVRACSGPMIACNGIGVAVAGAAIALAIGHRQQTTLRKPQESRDISQTIQLGMLGVVLVGFVITVAFTAIVQRGMTHADTSETLLRDLADAKTYVESSARYVQSPAQRVGTAVVNRHVGQNGQLLAYAKDGSFVSTRLDAQANAGEAEQLLRDLSQYPSNTMRRVTYVDTDYFAAYEDIDGYRIVAILPVDEADTPLQLSVLLTAYMEVLVFAALFVAIYLLISRVVVHSIQRVNGRLNEITTGNLDVVVDVRNSTEFASLSDDINATVAALRRLIAAEGERIERDLATAKAIQRSALPRTFPPFPQIDVFDIFASMKTARAVGGDFYDFFLMDGHLLGFVVADVSDKGIPASLFMMAAKTEIANYLQSGMKVSEAIRSANWHLCHNNDMNMFVTAWIGVLNYDTGELSYVNAGHNPPVLRHDGTWTWLERKSGPMLGAFDIARYREHTIMLEPGDELFVYTDGVSEAFNASKEEFGNDRLEDFLMRNNNLHPRSLILGLRSELRQWASGVEQSDDITMLALEYGVPPEVTNTITVDATKAGFVAALDFVNEELARRLCPYRTQQIIDRLFTQLFHEMISGGAESVQVDYVFNLNPSALTVSLSSAGEEHNPLDVVKGDFDMSFVRDDNTNVVAFRQTW